MKRTLALLAALALAFAGIAQAEVTPKSLSVSQVVTSYTFPAKTKFVLLISDGTATCFYRLQNDRDEAADATASSTGNLQIKSGESKVYDLSRHTTTSGPDSQSPASYWKRISAICSTGQSATFRIESF